LYEYTALISAYASVGITVSIIADKNFFASVLSEFVISNASQGLLYIIVHGKHLKSAKFTVYFSTGFV
jgi:hypothetical protein